MLEALTRSRDPKLLAQIRERALDSLIESARWRWTGHSYRSRLILGRIAGIPEQVLVQQAADFRSFERILSSLNE